MQDTIFAQSSGKIKSGVAVFRISGRLCGFVLQKLTGKDFTANPNYIRRVKIRSPQSRKLIDDAMAVYFKSPHSFTGEDVAEIYTHGSIAISVMLTEAILSIEGIRSAEPGEFTQRAFLNNKFDLVQAEGISDLIDAETEMQHRLAARQIEGASSRVYDGWRKNIIEIIAQIEAYVDFPEEEIPEHVQSKAAAMAKKLSDEIESYINNSKSVEMLRSGIKLAIIGQPNSGKSSMMNFLMQREVSIVSNIPGTTRDIVEAHLDIAGYPVILQDSAGLRDTQNKIEIEGIKRARNIANNADIVIIMHDLSDCHHDKFDDLTGNKNTLHVFNKTDLVDQDFVQEDNKIFISLKNEVNTNLILKRIEKICTSIAIIPESPVINRTRHKMHLQNVLAGLERFLNQDDIVMALEDLRTSTASIGQITGKISLDEILDDVFSNFCIGK